MGLEEERAEGGASVEGMIRNRVLTYALYGSGQALSL